MTGTIKNVEKFPLSRIFLSLDNPRHEKLTSEATAIAELCKKEDVLPLARDIAKYGLNPLERFALLAVNSRSRSKKPPSYYVVEGNRRMCALKLLHDPELAPPEFRKQFAALAEEFDPPSSVPVAIFDDVNVVKHWLERIHNGSQGGIGRKDWNSEQKQRFYGGAKNRVALALLDYAEEQGILSKDERAGKLTTVQRFVGNNTFREAIGLDTSVENELSRTRPKPEFDKLVKIFIRDLIGKVKVNSRMNSDKIVRYARSLGATAGVRTKRVEPEPVAPATATARKKKKSKPVKPEHARHVEHDEEMQNGLDALKNEKLLSLYHSICDIELDPHTPIVAVGVWSFVETLTACAGRKDLQSFDAYLSKDKLRQYGISGELNTLRAVMNRIREYGNTTKHHPVAVTFNGDQLNNDMLTFRPVLIKCIAEAIANSK